jgi:hypothetical protein
MKADKTGQARGPVPLKFSPRRVPFASASQNFGRDGISVARLLPLAPNFNFPASFTFPALATAAA